MPQASKSRAVIEEAKAVAAVTAGFFAGAMAGKAIDNALKVDATLPGFNAKRFITPAVQLGAGTLGAVKSKNSLVKQLSMGFAAAGAAKVVEVVAKKNFLAGLPMAGTEMNVYEPFHELPRLLPNPALSETPLKETLAQTHSINFI